MEGHAKTKVLVKMHNNSTYFCYKYQKYIILQENT